MNEFKTYPIWDSATGITDLGPNPQELGGSETAGIKAVWGDQRDRLRETPQLYEFTERLAREWAIETGIIENAYSIDRGVTETLIERGFRVELISHGSTDKPADYVVQVLRDQKDALDGVFQFVKSERPLSVSYIKELHAALLRSQVTTEGRDSQWRLVEVELLKGDWKTQPNYPVRDGVQFTYCPPEHVGSEMDRLVELYAAHEAEGVPPDVQAAWLHHRFTQIHPFQDGNGRVARAIASFVLVKAGLFPLVVTRDDKAAYIAALESADKGDLRPLIELFVRLQIMQFRKSSSLADDVVGKGDVDAALRVLARAADRPAASALSLLDSVFELAGLIEQDLQARLQTIEPDIIASLRRVSDGAEGAVERADAETAHRFQRQIFDLAARRFGYIPNAAPYQSWIALTLHWSRSCKLVFAIHGIGMPFNGSLICVPFVEFAETSETGEWRDQLISVADPDFIFFFNEDPDRLLARFRPWRDEVISSAIQEIARRI